MTFEQAKKALTDKGFIGTISKVEEHNSLPAGEVIRFSPATDKTIEVDETVTLSPNVSPSDAVDKTVTWQSDNEAVATVDNGVVTGVGTGTAEQQEVALKHTVLVLVMTQDAQPLN